MDSAPLPQTELTATAYHEAGHAVVALFLGRPVHEVTIEPNSLRLGQCRLNKGNFKPSKDVLEGEILILLAGVAAEARYRGDYRWEGAVSDLRQVRHFSSMRATNIRQVERLEQRLLNKVEHILSQAGPWLAVEEIARELISRTTISGRSARHHFELAMERFAE